MICSLEEVIKKVDINSSIVLCNGCYDLFHIGHIKHLKDASEYGDVLVVMVASDKFVKSRKNERLIFNEDERAEAIDALECVDYVIIRDTLTAMEGIKLLKPNYYVKGGEYKNKTTPGITLEKKTLKEVGGVMGYTIDYCSTTNIIRRIKDEVSNN